MKSLFLNVFDVRKSISFWVILLLIFINGWYGKNLKRWNNNNIIDNDVTQYYAYFPATFIYNDWKFDFVKTLPEDFEGRIWLLNTPDGKPVLKMTMGLSMLWLPFETFAHIYAKLSLIRADGYSKPYSIGIFLASLFYLFLGLFFLRKLLLKYFGEIVVSISLFLIVIGTNMMYYVISEPGMSHVYNFSLITIFIYLCTKWLKNPSWYFSLLIGVVSGFIALIRPINVAVLIIPLLWEVTSKDELIKRLLFFVGKWKMVSLAILAAFVIFLPQLIYWKVATGHWLYYSYGDEKFFFLQPHIIDGLFSYRKGWLVYTPVMAVALFGFIFLHKYIKGVTLALALTLVLAVYFVFSWWSWWYGGSFGSRPMIDYYGLMALLLAAAIQQIIKSKLWIKTVSIVILGFLVYFNQFQMSQYRTSLLHWDSMTKQAYWAILFEKQWPPDYDKLIKTPDYDKAKKGKMNIKPKKYHTFKIYLKPLLYEKVKTEPY